MEAMLRDGADRIRDAKLEVEYVYQLLGDALGDLSVAMGHKILLQYLPHRLYVVTGDGKHVETLYDEQVSFYDEEWNKVHPYLADQ